ncbi:MULTISPECIES: glycosyltransferase family 2 protein [unclassified Aurantimonas]|uniref:glycosyltransferase family 2 protein n=1 Tax=unclassified Aurantimonas TaxID=2638230 RepID=UPI002E19B020|nr:MULTISPECIES: glycosyltransferase family 2 protein [unclassified Aurantimonas]MEC5292968.1 glycosyltransferase family 2 protein [Aurantimonas sp. C2-3-R2]MEC5414153.1 glycosyltransferase family 2 protein [Aurantimonas sp. C2-4-R8]
MKITTVMVCFNSEATIAKSIDSFLAQDHADRELLVIDGASRDRTCDIVRAYGSPLIRLVSESDKGIYDALNKGIAAASGEVIGVLHSNDLFAGPGVLSQIAQAFAQPELDAVYADVVFFKADAPERTARHFRSDRFSPGTLGWGIMPAHTTLFLRRRVFDRFGQYKTDYKIAGDYEFIARVFHKTGVVSRYIPAIWVRMLAGGASTAGLRSKLLLNREVVRACRENGISTNYFKILSKYPAKLLENLQTGGPPGARSITRGQGK